MTQDNQEEDILLKLSMAGKSLRMNTKDAPQLSEQKTEPQSSQQATPAVLPTNLQPQREANTVVPPANTPPPTEEAQDSILRKLSMKPKEYEVPKPEIPKEPSPQLEIISQTSAEAHHNKPYVSSEHEIEKVKKLAQTIIGSDIVAKKVKKK